jgi:hypothetical protein
MLTSKRGYLVASSIAIGLMFVLCPLVVCKAQGVDVENGDSLQADANNGQGHTHEGVRHVPICDELARAAGEPGKPYGRGRDSFIGHQDWIATLICEYISRAIGKPPPFETYERRREFVAMVLDAIQREAKLDTAAIARPRILVGRELYVIRTAIFGGREARAPLRLRSKIDIVRSKDDPNIMLLGFPYERFVVKNARNLTGSSIRDLKPAIKAAELAIIGIYALAEGSRLMSERDVDEFTPDIEQETESKIESFEKQYHLENHDKTPQFQALLGGNENDANEKPQGWNEREEAEKARANKFKQALANMRIVAAGDTSRGLNLQFESLPAPDPQTPGLTRIIYQPLPVLSRAYRDDHRWYVEQLGLAQAAADADGVTSPGHKLLWEDAQTILDPDRLFDETTPAPIRTILNVHAFCIVRILYHAQPGNAGVTTQQVRGHEEKHYQRIRDAWERSIQTLEGTLQPFADHLNHDLNLNGDSAFQVKPVESRTDVLALQVLPAEGESEQERKSAKLLAVPTGWIAKEDDPRLAHSFPHINKLNFRIVRQTTAMQSNGEPLSGTALAKTITDEKMPDPKKLDQFAERAEEQWKNWKKDVFNPDISFEFERNKTISTLELDAEEGRIDEKTGRFAARPEVAGTLRAVQQRFADEPRTTDPRDILKHLKK